MDKPTDEKTVKEQLRAAISAFCRWRVNQTICEEGDCEFCPINNAYDMARNKDEDE